MYTLLSIYGTGAGALILSFILCFFFVHLARLVRLGWQAQKHSNQTNTKPSNDKPTEKPKEKQSEKTAPEPVYYIVERKRRVKSGYSEPKQIRFK